MNTRFKVFASSNILQYLCDFIHVLIFVTVSKCRKSPKLTNLVILLAGRERVVVVLLVRLTETLVIWLSEDQDFWYAIEDGETRLGPIGLQQVCSFLIAHGKCLWVN
jgi:hypothetical protein